MRVRRRVKGEGELRGREGGYCRQVRGVGFTYLLPHAGYYESIYNIQS